MDQNRPLIIILIDGLSDQHLQALLQEGASRAFAPLLEHGAYSDRVIAPFPSLPLCQQASLLTGVPPQANGINGHCFYQAAEERIACLHSDHLSRAGDSIQNGFFNANHTWLRESMLTLHEAYRGDTASLGLSLYRGPFTRSIALPWRIAAKFSFQRSLEIQSPAYFSLGNFSGPRKRRAGATYGLCDAQVCQEALDLIRQRQLPLLSFLCLPDFSLFLQEHGGAKATAALQKTDATLYQLLRAFGSVRDALHQVGWVVLGGGKSELVSQSQAYLDPTLFLPGYTILDSSHTGPIPEEAELVFCPNERCGYLYRLQEDLPASTLARQLQREGRLDLIAWYDEERVRIISGTTPGELAFRPDPEGTYGDEYGQRFLLHGDKSLLGLTVEQEEGQLLYGLYPDGLMRLWNCFVSDPQVIVMTCAPGFLLADKTRTSHAQVAGGSLHRVDSYAPLLVAGTETLPPPARVTEIAPWILSLLPQITE